jgi:hypothetical protein
MVAGIKAELERAKPELKLVVETLPAGPSTPAQLPAAPGAKIPPAPQKSTINLSKLTTSAVSKIASSMSGASDVAARSYTALAQAYGVTRFAKGGIALGPTAGIIGEAGPEMVVPLSGANSVGMGGTYNITVNAGIGTNGAQVGRDIVEAIRKYERSSGQVFVRV